MISLSLYSLQARNKNTSFHHEHTNIYHLLLEAVEDDTTVGASPSLESTGTLKGMLCPQGCCWKVFIKVEQSACCEREEDVEAATMMGMEEIVKFIA